MRLKDLLSENKSTILKRWFDDIMKTYPSDTSRFLKKHKNQFTNPVGHVISEGIERIFEELLNDMEADRVSPLLDSIVRIKAVQDLDPSRALAFIFLLKNIVREGFEKEIREHDLNKELQEFESNIDAVALFAFDIYVSCREKIYDLKANELKRWTYRIVERANQKSGDEEPYPGNGNN